MSAGDMIVLHSAAGGYVVHLYVEESRRARMHELECGAGARSSRRRDERRLGSPLVTALSVNMWQHVSMHADMAFQRALP